MTDRIGHQPQAVLPMSRDINRYRCPEIKHPGLRDGWRTDRRNRALDERNPSGTVGAMYVPSANAVEDPATVLRLLRSIGVGQLVSQAVGEGFDVTVIPFLIDDDLSIVRAHVARANPQWRSLDGAPAMLLVPGGDAYVSPAWYPSKAEDPRVVPTWNYEVIQLHGTVRIHDDAPFVEHVVRELTARHEEARGRWDATPGWSVDDAPPDFIARQLRAIIGVELTVTRVDGKRKLSQNRSTEDQLGVRTALAGSPQPTDRGVAEAMEARNEA